jgi:hypothetical protein
LYAADVEEKEMAFPVKYRKALLDEEGCENDKREDNGNPGTI